VSVAAVNGPAEVVISGEGEAIGEIMARIENENVRWKELKVSHAFHSPMMDGMLEEFERYVERIEKNSPQKVLISNVTGKEATDEIQTARYWSRHVREAVRFEDGIRTLAEQG